MKKSKIIIPAAAILALSVGASVTGTVAWFTASRSVTLTAKNVAAINAAGDLEVTLAEGNGTKVNGKTVTLSYLRDVSMDVSGTKTDVYHAVLDTTGKSVIGTRKLLDNEKTSFSTVSVDEAKFGGKSIKVYNFCSWSATFTTSSNSANCLYFDSDLSKSFIAGKAETSIYDAIRISMKVGSDETLVWAPYTTLAKTEIAHINGEGTLATPQESNKAAVVANYKTSGEPGTSLTANYERVIKDAETAVSSGEAWSTASKRTGLLSKTLKSGAPVTVSFNLWFEGLDPHCLTDGIGDITTVGTKVAKDLQLSFYAVDTATLPGYTA
ncbi:MAG: hypothetical protein PUK09_02670 [Bacilli bacterium]|nr:hypothetical protein [Bacilli bacterium]